MKLAFLYRQNDVFYSGKHFDNTLYHFYFHALKRNPNLEVSYRPYDYTKGFDVSELKEEDALLVSKNPLYLPKYFKGIEKFGKPVIVRVGDPHSNPTFESPYDFRPDYCFGFYQLACFTSIFQKSSNTRR